MKVSTIKFLVIEEEIFMYYLKDDKLVYVNTSKHSHGYKMIFGDKLSVLPLVSAKVGEHGWGYHIIDKNVIDEAVRDGLLTKVADNSGRKHARIRNEYYAFVPKPVNPYDPKRYNIRQHSLCIVTMNYGDFLIKNQRIFCIIDADPNLVRFLSTGTVFLKVGGEDEKNSATVFSNNRHTVVFSHPDPNIVAKNSNISLATMIGKLRYGCEGDIDGHHEMMTVDNRIGSIQILPEEAHKKVHAITGHNSHRLDAEIKTLKALKRYIKFMESGDYRALFAAEL